MKDGILEICTDFLEWSNGETSLADSLLVSGDGMDSCGRAQDRWLTLPFYTDGRPQVSRGAREEEAERCYALSAPRSLLGGMPNMNPPDCV